MGGHFEPKINPKDMEVAKWVEIGRQFKPKIDLMGPGYVLPECFTAIEEKIQQLEENLKVVFARLGMDRMGKGWYRRTVAYSRDTNDPDEPEWVNGEVHWTSKTGAVYISGSILDLYHKVNPTLGFPLHDKRQYRMLGLPIASYVAFSNGGAIYDSKKGGTHEIYGAIFMKWMEMFNDKTPGKTFPGFPTTGENGVADGVGRYNNFERGSIYWSPNSGAHFIDGPVRDRWLSLGGPSSYLRYPITSTQSSDGQTEFQRGRLFIRDGQVVESPSSRVINSGTVHVPGGTPVNGWTQVAIWSNGAHLFRGNVHTSGAPSFEVTMTVFPLYSDNSGATRIWSEKGTVEGSLVLGGSRDDPWDYGVSQDPWVADNWEQLSQCEFRTNMRVDFRIDDVLAMIGTTIGIPIALVIGVVFLGWASSTTKPCGRYDENGNPEVEFVDKNRPCPPGYIEPSQNK